jgi:phosphoribosyl 1,2-cyclic phosphodiesterase
MVLKVLGSSSSGNCYILESDTEALIIETGLPFMEVKKALNFNVRKVVGVVVSHSHGDHSKYIWEYEKAGIKVFKPYDICNGNADSMGWPHSGKFYVKAFKLVHDVPCYGFYITHPDIGNLIYASDTEYIKYRFKNLNHILVEANYSDDLIEQDAVNREHILWGHMSLQTALNFISTNDNPALKNVVLLHLSDKNSDSEKFLQKTKETVKYGADCYIAEKGLAVDLNLIPF